MRVPSVGEQFGRYQLDRVLGQGGMGVVFAATDPRLRRTVALKVITGVLARSPEFRARFQAEAAALARLDSPHVTAIHDHDEVDGTPYIVTQYVDGRDLWSWLREHGAMPAPQALELCAQLARGLADAHRAGVVHRDVKPSNVLIRHPGTADQHAYLCDFGIARTDGADGADGAEGPAPTAAGTVAGTWSYLSPERTEGLPATPSSDVYALGCVLWACLTGREPYQGTDAQIALAHQQAPVPRLPGTAGFTAELNAVLGRALAKDPADRYPDATSFRADLERLAAAAPAGVVEGPASAPGAGTVVRDAAPPPPPPPSGRSRWSLVVAGVVVLALAAGVTGWLVVRDDDSPPASPDGEEPTATVAGDLTGDRYGDVLVHQTRFEALNPLSVWTVPSSGLQFGSPQRAGAEAGLPRFGDVDGDGRTDVVWLDEDDDRLSVVVVPGAGERWTTELDLDPVFDIKPYSASVGDLDGDGRDDLVLYGDQTDELDGLHVALAQDRGFAAPRQWYSSELSDSSTVAGDFDGDGRDELVYFGTDAERNDVLRLLRPEDGTLVAVAEKVLGGKAVNPLLAQWLVGDVDGDGADELVAPNATGRAIFVYDIADDAFAPRTRWFRTRISVDDARRNLYDSGLTGQALSDVDGDGDADLVQLRYAANDGTEDDGLNLFVQLSDGSSFGDPQQWGSLACAPECDDGFELVG
ncbi:serine/threonine-protein kinase [Nocardioides sp. L-11A]|uniref:serine/threonine-protein kinase n=1 Tax=Nocardioides sp. L-11A TaxID=3043848 RepID=UPI002499D7AB|nr:protein kinase [Nocardioides sp. L-11A]